MKRQITLVSIILVSFGSLIEVAAQKTDNREQTYAFRRKGHSTDDATKKVSADGIKTIEGKITGLLVQLEKFPSETGETSVYIVINGEDILAIDENGVKTGSSVLVFIVIRLGKDLPPLNDAHVVAVGLGSDAPAGFPATVLPDVPMMRQKANPPKPLTSQLLGELGLNSRTKEIEIRPSITVTTENGEVTIPVKQIVKFKADPKEVKR